MSLRPGEQFGGYEIVASLGAGGMGEVYRARDKQLQRDVAIKVLPTRTGGDPLAVARFHREARAIAALSHPNIVTIYAVDDADGRAFIAMELVDGQTLADRIPANGLPLESVLAYAIPLADALNAAHTQGITHRDLKPGNVMVGNDGRIKVLDFGLAKLGDDVVQVQDAKTTRALTGQGQIVGTVAYMSPEQASGALVDQRSDLFSLGVMLYEMATGQRPFTGDGGVSVLASILKDTPKPVTELRPSLPRDFGRIVRRALAKDPEQRYQTAKDLRIDLQTLKDDLTSGGIAATPQPVASRRSWAGVVVAALLVCAVAIVGYLWFGRSPESDRSSSDTRAISRLTSTGKAALVAVSPDGKYVAHTVVDEGESIWLRQTATGSNVPIVPSNDRQIFGLTFSPDGNYVYFTRAVGPVTFNLFRVPTLGGTPELMVKDTDSAVSVSPNGARVAFVRAVASTSAIHLMTAAADGSDTPASLAHGPILGGYPVYTRPAWSPDGRRIAVARGGGSPVGFPAISEGRVVLVDVATGAERALTTPRWSVTDSLAWLDNDTILVSAAETGTLNFQIWRVAAADGSVRRITNDLNSYQGVSVVRGANPSIVTVLGEFSSTISVMTPGAATSLVRVTRGGGRYDGQQALAWSDDGRLVYSSAAGGQIDLWMSDADGQNARQLTSNADFEMQPCLTTGGRSVVYVTGGVDRRGLSRLDVQTRRVTNLTDNASDMSPHCLKDDSGVVFSRTPVGVFRVGFDGAPAVQVDPSVTGGVTSGFFDTASADGRFLAGFTAAPVNGKRLQIAVVPVNGPESARGFSIVSLPVMVRFRGNDALGFLESRKRPRGIWMQALAGGPPSFLTDVPGERIFNFAFAPDGRLAIAHGPASTDVVMISGVK